ncbi:hypothetical protein HK098_003652 [Nowakowskiella sp. JEL0407]|nr:hypothetical protein HK098_003652 [Nowakowskiella sp. JEL0407]
MAVCLEDRKIYPVKSAVISNRHHLKAIKREAEVLARPEGHVNVIKMKESFSDGKLFYLVLEYLSGENLASD